MSSKSKQKPSHAEPPPTSASKTYETEVTSPVVPLPIRDIKDARSLPEIAAGKAFPSQDVSAVQAFQEPDGRVMVVCIDPLTNTLAKTALESKQ